MPASGTRSARGHGSGDRGLDARGMMSVRLNSSRTVYAVGLVVTPRCVAYSAANRVPGESWRPS